MKRNWNHMSKTLYSVGGRGLNNSDPVQNYQTCLLARYFRTETLYFFRTLNKFTLCVPIIL